MNRISRIVKFPRVLLPPPSVKKTFPCATFHYHFQKFTFSTVNNMTTYSADYIKEKLVKELDATHVEVIDESNCGCGMKFSCVIVSDKFKGKPLLQRHRLVNASLAEELKLIHAFSQKTYTIDQWKEAEANNS